VNNSCESSKGIGANIPFSSSFSTWGGTLEVKPADWAYIKGGLFLAFPNSTSSSNHGLAFEGYAQDPNLNSQLWMAEVGVTPKIGPSELDGHYAAGGYFYGVDKNSFNGTHTDGVYGFYWQADQMLYREPSPEPEPVVYEKGASDGKSIADTGKSFKEPVPMEDPKLSDQGLYTFNLITFAPKYNNPLAFYFQSGLVYKGLIPSRDKDQFMVAFGLGQYSFLNIEQLQDNGKTNQPNYTAVLEVDYRIQINGWAYTQPFVQYIIKPNGAESVKNATILGVLSGVTF
jgi:carbohydrate-selective porin OprB